MNSLIAERNQIYSICYGNNNYVVVVRIIAFCSTEDAMMMMMMIAMIFVLSWRTMPKFLALLWFFSDRSLNAFSIS